MKNQISLVAALCVGVVGLSASNAIGGSTAVGSNCHVYWHQFSTPPPALIHTNAISHGLYDDDAQLLGVTCLLPTENTLGTTVNFRARVFDNSETTPVTCYGVVYNQNGSSVATTSELTTSAAGIGVTNLTGSVSVVPQSSTYTYGINCTLPGDQSAIYSVRAY
jgi:hypothetical protein